MIEKLRNRVANFFASVARIFMPPFHGLPFIIGCFFVFSYIGQPNNPIWAGDLPDPDDYTYLSQTLDWLQGQGWFDNVQHRMAPPEGVPIHYTRIAEMPIAALIMLFRSFHYTWQGAALLASFLLPIIYLGFLFIVLRWTLARLVSPDWARLGCFIVLFANAYMFKFAPGQVDHHGLEGILTIVVIGLCARMFAQPEQGKWAAGAGCVLALALAIALETLPWLGLTAAVIGLWTVIQGPKAKKATEIFAASLLMTSAMLLTIEKAPSDIWHPDILAYSVTYVILVLCIAVTLFIAATATRIQNIKLRFTVSGAAAIIIGAAFLTQYPSLIGGPYGAMDPVLAKLFFSNLEEAQPMTERYTLFKGLLRLATPLIGLAASFVFMRRAVGDKKWIWSLVTVLLTAAIGFAVFYQVRVLLYALLFAVLPLTFLLERGWGWIDKNYQDRKKFWMEIGLIMLVGPLTAVFLPALQDGRSFNTGVILFPAQTFDDTCGLRGLEKVLASPEYAAHAPLRIMNMINEGPEMLFRTPQAVMSAPYHTNVRGNLDALNFFSTTDMDKAHDIAQRDGINLVTLCRHVPDMYLAGNEAHYVSLPDGEIRMRPNASVAGQLIFHKLPDWLVEIPVPAPSNYLLFAVK